MSDTSMTIPAELEEALNAALVEVVEAQEHPNAEAIADHLRKGEEFTFEALATLLQIDVETLVAQFERAVFEYTGQVLIMKSKGAIN
jgi:hypothetical protein